jgi:hypothetical protein
MIDIKDQEQHDVLLTLNLERVPREEGMLALQSNDRTGGCQSS